MSLENVEVVVIGKMSSRLEERLKRKRTKKDRLNDEIERRKLLGRRCCGRGMTMSRVTQMTLSRPVLTGDRMCSLKAMERVARSEGTPVLKNAF